MSRTSAEPGAATEAEVLVVGAGPAGMAAAVQASEAGCAVTVIDTYPAPGGQYHRSLSEGIDTRGARYGAKAGAPPVATFRALVDAGRVTLHSGTTIWTATVEDGAAPFALHLTRVGDPTGETSMLRARAVILATGANDRVLPFPGWDLPGVFTAGGAQALLKGQAVRVGEQVVVGGSGPFLLPVAAALAAAGSTVSEIAEAQGLRGVPAHVGLLWSHPAKVVEAAGYLRTLARHRVPMRMRSAVTAAAGDGRVEEVTVSRLAPDWSPLPGSERTLAVDAACVSFGFVPQVGLAVLLGCAIAPDPVWRDQAVRIDGRQATSVPGVFAAGEITGVSGFEGAAVEGAIAGLAAAAALGHLDDATFSARAAAPGRARARHRRFAATLGALYRQGAGWVGWLTDDTTICRCEEVPHGVVRAAVGDLAAGDLRSVKMTTRCGMGYCQGRMCGDAVAAIVARETGRPAPDAGALSAPPLLTPVTLAQLAGLGDAPDDDGSTHRGDPLDRHHAARPSTKELDT